MESNEFLAASAEMSEFIANYTDNIRKRRVLPNVEPNYIRPLLPESAPENPEQWKDIMEDIEKVIMPGITHWNSPYFHAYFPAASTYPSILADMLCGAIGCIGFTWISSPACTELEMVMMDWLVELIGLPKEFLFKSNTGGGGVIQGTASEATLIALLAAKSRKIKEKNNNQLTNELTPKLVAYASEFSHCSVERAGLLGGVQLRLLTSDDNYSLRGDTLKKAVKEDLEKGLHPFYVVATIGTTSSCAVDNLKEIGEVAKEFGLWTHVDAAYAGSAFVCEEYRHLMIGVENADSFNFNPHKWLLVNFDCSAFWVKNYNDLTDAFNVDPLYLQHQHQGAIPDYRHWQIPLGRRFRSLKLWFVLRIYGRIGLQKHIRKQIALAKEFEELVKQDSRFEIVAPVTFGLVCFRLKSTNEVNETLLKKINENGVIHLIPSKIRDVFFLRFAVCSRLTESGDVLKSWKEIQSHADHLVTLDETKSLTKNLQTIFNRIKDFSI